MIILWKSTCCCYQQQTGTTKRTRISLSSLLSDMCYVVLSLIDCCRYCWWLWRCCWRCCRCCCCWKQSQAWVFPVRPGTSSVQSKKTANEQKGSYLVASRFKRSEHQAMSWVQPLGGSACFFRCLSRFVCWPKQRSQRRHLNGRSLLCIFLTWRCKFDEILKDRSQ